MDTFNPADEADPTIDLGERKLTLQPALAELKALQKKVGGLVALLNAFVDKSVTIEQIAQVVHHGARGCPDQEVPSAENIEQMLYQSGIINAFKPCADYLRMAMTGPRSGAAKKA